MVCSVLVQITLLDTPGLIGPGWILPSQTMLLPEADGLSIFSIGNVTHLDKHPFEDTGDTRTEARKQFPRSRDVGMVNDSNNPVWSCRSGLAGLISPV